MRLRSTPSRFIHRLRRFHYHSLLNCGWFYHFNLFFTSAGTPATRESGGTSFVTTDPAPVTERAPTRTGATSIVSEPTLTSSSMIVSCFLVPSKLHVTVPAPILVRSPIVASPR